MHRITASRWRYLGLVVLLGLYLVQCSAAAPQHSVTFDEQYHLTPGYVYLTQHDLRFHHDQNPPLFEAILSAPLLARSDIQLPIEHPAYQLWGDVYLFSDAFFWHSGNDPDSLVQAGRMMAALTGVLLGLLLFVWGKQLFGELAGWLALFLFVFDPNFIANAIPTLDLPLAFTVTLALYCLWRYLKRPTALALILTGLALGFALATKFLSVMLLPSFLIILLVYPVSSSLIPHPSSFIKRLLAFGAMLLLAYLVIWITYLLQLGPVNGAGLPVPAPQYFESFIGMFFKSSEGRANYLLGQTSVTGWWYYFIVAFFLKTPLPTMFAIAFALVRWPWRKEWRATTMLIVPALLFFFGASISKLQLGYRYLLPALPFLFLMAGRVGADVMLASTQNLSPARKRFLTAQRVGMALLGAWLVISAVITFPHHLSYFNELVGGSFNGYKYLTDSNVDWGQDLPTLKNWIDLKQPDRLQLAYFGSAYPDRYGVNAIALPSYPNSAYDREADAFTSYSLDPGRYAISATLLRIGLVSRLFNAYQAFQAMTPIDQPAPSILIYDVQYPPDGAIDRAVITSGTPASQVLPDDLGYRVDHPLRVKWCEADQCAILTPHPARYITLELPKFVQETASVVPSSASAYRIYQLDATAAIDQKLQQLQASAISTTYPITFENGLVLAGYEVVTTQEPIINTYWRVTGELQPPLTVFVHLLDRDGNIVAQDDRFDAAARMLEPGDLIVQRHPIPLDTPLPPGTYQIAVGLYNPDTLARFKTQAGEERLLLGIFEVKP